MNTFKKLILSGSVLISCCLIYSISSNTEVAAEPEKNRYGCEICQVCPDCPPTPTPCPPKKECEECETPTPEERTCEVTDCHGNVLPEDACKYDANGDGVVNEADSSRIIGYLNQKQRNPELEFIPSLDVNGSDSITALDSLQILNYLERLGVDCNCPPGEEDLGCGCGEPEEGPCGCDSELEDLGCGCGNPAPSGCGCDPTVLNLGCGCGEPAPGPCGCDHELEDLGCGCGNPAPSGCGCDPTVLDLGCGCGNPAPGPCGCDECEETCSGYDVTVKWKGGKFGNPSNSARTVSGEGAELECVRDIVLANGGCFKPSKNDSCDDRVYETFKRIGNGTGNSTTYVMDNNCQKIENFDEENLCGHLGVLGFSSPISLIFDEDVAFEKSTIVSFPLSSNKGVVTWRASDSLPLLIYDPKNTNNVTTPKQLFGEWTFGGKSNGIDDLYSDYYSEPWGNGYKALAVLDKNKDGEISGAELDGVKLWFDKNMNGISEEGEIRELSSLEITRLFYKGAKKEDTSRDLFLEIGYEKIEDGKKVFGRSVDWYGQEFQNEKEAIDYLLLQSIDKKTSSNKHNSNNAKNYSSKMDELIGIWRWDANISHFEGEEKMKPKGLLVFFKEGESLRGVSVIEIPVATSAKENVKSIIQLFPVNNLSLTEYENRNKLSFTVNHNDKVSTFTNSFINNNVIEGHSIFSLNEDGKNRVEYDYTWKARKMTNEDI